MVVLSVVLGIALVGCGSSDNDTDAEQGDAGSDPVAWVGKFCGGVGEVLNGAAALREPQPDPQAQKDALLGFIDNTQKAMNTAADQLRKLGPPAVPNGQQVHDTAVGFFASTAETVIGQRERLEALDPQAPDFYEQLSQLPQPDLQAVSNQAQQLTGNPDLAPAFREAPECRQLNSIVSGDGS